VIQSFKDPEAEAIFTSRRRSKRYGNLQNVIERKLFMLDRAIVLHDLAKPPGNQLEALQRDRLGQHAIRINQQYRLCFRWTATGPADVEITDYH
jgi:proteic killer suppression protein